MFFALPYERFIISNEISMWGSKKMIHEKFIDDEAVSPVVGTILMVAITVIMAAIIASWSAGIKAPQTPATVGLDVARSTQYNVTITITSIDPPQTVINNLNATFTNGSSVMVKRVLLGKGAPNSTGYSASGEKFGDLITNYLFSGSVSEPTSANVGDSATIWIKGYSEFIVITSTFGDGTVKTLYSQKV